MKNRKIKLLLVAFISLVQPVIGDVNQPMINTSEHANSVTIPLEKQFSALSNPETKHKAPLPIDLRWLKFQKEIHANWRIANHPDKPDWLRIIPQSSGTESAPQFRVLVLVSKKSGSYQLALAKLLEVFDQRKVRAQIDVVNISGKRHLHNSAVSYAESLEMDLIFSVGSETAGFLYDDYWYGKIPVVTSTNKDPVLLGQLDNYVEGNGGNIAFTSLNVPLNIQMDYIRTLKPNLKAMVLMYNQNHKQVMATEVHSTKKILKDMGIQALDVAVTSRGTAVAEMEERIPVVMDELRAIDPSLKDVIFWVTSSTAVFANMATINQFTGQVPVLAAIPNAVVEGDDSAVIAIGIDRRSNAHLAALYAIDILTKGVAPGDLPVGIVTPPDIAVNFKIARKLELKIPLRFFESASFIYDYDGRIARDFGQNVKRLGNER